ncbi:hypothetical protein [Cupriavidus sp. DL-D2]|uniref:hypothetical protein n=1 Tax=Cupriavidus sp. DL-D2 TaxID=3144974 RepID=UPI003215CEBA
MKKGLILAVLASLIASTTTVQAVDFEIGAGVAQYTTRGDGTWYQDGFAHKLELRAPAVEIGLTDTFVTRGRWGLDWHVGGVYLGNVHSDAWATPLDSNYSAQTKSCVGECYHMSRYVANGHSIGAKLTLEPTYTFNGWRFGVEAGAYVYRPTWHATIYDVPPCKACQGQTLTASSPSTIQFAPVVGVSIGRNGFSLALMHYFNKTRNDPQFAIWKSTSTLMLKYRF